MSIFSITKTIIKNLFRRPYTVKHPFGPVRPFYKNTRGSIAIEIENCIFCGVCQKKCPPGAITVDRDKKTWSIDRGRCIVCSACVESCPKKCLIMDSRYAGPVTGQKEEVFRNA